jgi:SNF2 family DNA or RNA helicase
MENSIKHIDAEFGKMIDKNMEGFIKYLDRTGMDHKQYQYDGVRWCLENELRADPVAGVRGGFIADEMGLGKTIMMIGTCLTNFVRNTLIILPPVLIDQWASQILRTTGHKALVYYGNNKKKINLADLKAAPIVITSYEGICLDNIYFTKAGENIEMPLLFQISWGRIIFDEAHHLRNKKTRRYCSARMLKAGIRWLVSGTPVQNSRGDFYALCSLLGLPASYYSDACKFEKDLFILRRTKASVGISLPELSIDYKTINWGSDAEKEMSVKIHNAAFYANSDEKLVLMLRARQSCVYPKMVRHSFTKFVNSGVFNDYSVAKEAIKSSSKLDAICASILEQKDNGCGKLIFCQFREEIDEIARRLQAGGLGKIVTFDGRTSFAKRRAILNEKADALILQIQTGCEGLNLQENYSEIYFISPHWNPSIEDQAIARCHRIGQNKPVLVKRFMMSDFVIGDKEEDEEEKESMINIENYVTMVQDNKRLIASTYIN